MLKSIEREEVLKRANESGEKQQASDDEEDKISTASNPDLEEMEEQDARIGLVAIFGACMKVSPEVFVAHSLPTLQPMMQKWFASKADPGRLLGLHIACDICDHLGASAVNLWPIFISAAFESLLSEQADERNASAFIMLLAAQVPDFGPQYSAQAYAALGTSLRSFKAKKSDEDAQRATDNVVAALAQLCLSHPATCPDLDGCWQAVLAMLPLKVDTEEGHKVNRKLFLEAQKPSGGSLGSLPRVAQVLGYLCDVYGHSEHCDEELQGDLRRAFAALPQETLQSLLAAFPTKRQRKAERILQDAQSGVLAASG